MNPIKAASQACRQLRAAVKTTQIASLGEQGPQVSYAPFVWHDHHLYLYLSDLARHTANLRRNPGVGLMLIEDEACAQNPFARRRLSLQGQAELISKDTPLYGQILAEFDTRFGSIMDVIAPLPDFHLFQIKLLSGQYIQGFGQAYRLVGEHLETLEHIDPRRG